MERDAIMSRFRRGKAICARNLVAERAGNPLPVWLPNTILLSLITLTLSLHNGCASDRHDNHSSGGIPPSTSFVDSPDLPQMHADSREQASAARAKARSDSLASCDSLALRTRILAFAEETILPSSLSSSEKNKLKRLLCLPLKQLYPNYERTLNSMNEFERRTGADSLRLHYSKMRNAALSKSALGLYYETIPCRSVSEYSFDAECYYLELHGMGHCFVPGFAYVQWIRGNLRQRSLGEDMSERGACLQFFLGNLRPGISWELDLDRARELDVHAVHEQDASIAVQVFYVIIGDGNAFAIRNRVLVNGEYVSALESTSKMCGATVEAVAYRVVRGRGRVASGTSGWKDKDGGNLVPGPLFKTYEPLDDVHLGPFSRLAYSDSVRSESLKRD